MRFMGQVRATFSIALDGYGAGARQDLDHPLGVRGTELMSWFFATRTWTRMHGHAGGSTGCDDAFAERGFNDVRAWILGRNMFGPVRGPWPDERWRGWWGEEPPYHAPVFVLTHHRRAPLAMAGGTTFHFVADGAEAALDRARAAAGDRDVRIGGGVATLRQYLACGSLDELHLALSPVLLGEGEPVFAGLNLNALGYAVVAVTPGENATHIQIEKQR